MTIDPSANPAAPAATDPPAEGAAPDVVAETVKAVRESLGLQEGERMDDKVRGIVTSSVQHNLGLPEGQKIGDVIADAIKAIQPSPPEPTSQKDIAAAELKAVAEAVTGMQTKLDTAEANVAAERRNNHIRDAIDKFPVNDGMKAVLTRSFIHGAEAEPVLNEDGTGLVINLGDGQSVDFPTFLGQYFEKNEQFLEKANHVGTGARGSTSTATNGGFKFDLNKYHEDGGRSLREEMAKNPDGADERMKKVAEELEKPVNAFFKRT